MYYTKNLKRDPSTAQADSFAGAKEKKTRRPAPVGMTGWLPTCLLSPLPAGDGWRLERINREGIRAAFHVVWAKVLVALNSSHLIPALFLVAAAFFLYLQYL